MHRLRRYEVFEVCVQDDARSNETTAFARERFRTIQKGKQMKYATLMEAQLEAYPDSIVLTDHQMYDALRSETPDWLIGHEFEHWDKYEARYEMGVFAGWYYDKWKEHMIEQTHARWARNALLYKWQNPEGFFYACCKKEDGTYRYVGFRYGLEESEYASGFDGMGYTPQGEKK
jgi:hypothetical protein